MSERIGARLEESSQPVYWVKKDGMWRSERESLAALGGESSSVYQGRRHIASLLNSGLVSALEARAAARAWRTGKISPSRPLVTLEAARLGRETRGQKRSRRLEMLERRQAMSGQNEGVARSLAARGWVEGAEWLRRNKKDWVHGNEDALLSFLGNSDRWSEWGTGYSVNPLMLRHWTLGLSSSKARDAIAVMGGPVPPRGTLDVIWAATGAVAASRNTAAVAEWTEHATAAGWEDGLAWMARNILPGVHVRPLRETVWKQHTTEGALFSAWAAAKSRARRNRLAVCAFTYGSLQARAVVCPTPATAAFHKCRCPGYEGKGWAGEDDKRGDPKTVEEWLEFWRRWAAACEVKFAWETF